MNIHTYVFLRADLSMSSLLSTSAAVRRTIWFPSWQRNFSPMKSWILRAHTSIVKGGQAWWDTVQISTVSQLSEVNMSGSWPCITHCLDSRVLGRVDKVFWVILILSHFPTVGSKKGKELILQFELGSARLQTVLDSHLANRAGRMRAGSSPLRTGHQVRYLSSVNAS